MHCFYEAIKERANIRIRVTAVNGASNEVHMRISSPNQVFSEWFQGVGLVEYVGDAVEGGDYEFCVTSRVSYGDLRINVELFAYVQEEIQKAVQDHMASNSIRDDMTKRIDQLFNNTWTSYYAMRYANLMIRRDEAAQEKNLFVIDALSSVQTLLFLVVACTQVYVVRKMFNVDVKRIRI
uniref:GOLD domain-containing protein n=1 Tax=Steinernema glaseri TaxID=37863 RepID=A0A1I7Y958_9BILA